MSGTTIINGETSILSSMNILNDANISENGNIYGSINILGNTILNNTTTINSSLSVSGITSLLGNVTLGSNLSIYGNIINEMQEYQNNSSALAGGIPLWGLYRTGGIIKICLDEIPPVLTLLGLTMVSIFKNSSYTDSGIIAIDYENNNLLGYMTFLGTGVTNLIESSILITGISTLITQTNILSKGTYNIIYNATDNIGNIGSISRILNII